MDRLLLMGSVFLAATLLAAALVAPVSRLARRLGVLDHPGHR